MPPGADFEFAVFREARPAVVSFAGDGRKRCEHIRLGGYPAPFRDLLGLWVEEFSPLMRGQTNHIQTSDGATFTAQIVGNTITTFLNGTQLRTIDDSSIATGSPGIGF